MSAAIPTECMNCGVSETMTMLEALDWGKKHGPKKCKPKAEPELCGLDACDIGGECQARSQCRYANA